MNNTNVSLLHHFTSSLQTATNFSTVDEVTEVRFGDQSRNTRLDALVNTRTPDGESCQLAVEIVRIAYPRDVRLAISHLMKFRDTVPNDTRIALCLVAEAISPGSREALREAGINYCDLSGTLYFKHRTWLVDIERTPKRPTRKKDIALFSGAREQVVHALLHHWYSDADDGYVTGEELARLSHTSTYTVSSTMQALEQLDVVESKGNGPSRRRRLRDPATLLDAWAEAWPMRREVRTRWYTYSPGGNITDHVIDGFVKHARQEWAITGAAAANAIVPRLTSVDRVEVIVQPGEAERLASSIGLSQAEKGSNVIMIERTGASFLFLDEQHGRSHSYVTSKFIQYLDLLNGYGRNKELAEEFRKNALKIGSSK